jgi:hypothetical protein
VIGSRRRPRPRLLCVNAGVGTSVDESGSGVTGSSGVVCSGVVGSGVAGSGVCLTPASGLCTTLRSYIIRIRRDSTKLSSNVCVYCSPDTTRWALEVVWNAHVFDPGCCSAQSRVRMTCHTRGS